MKKRYTIPQVLHTVFSYIIVLFILHFIACAIPRKIQVLSIPRSC